MEKRSVRAFDQYIIKWYNLLRQPVNTPLICRLKDDITMSFWCNNKLKSKFTASPSSTSIWSLGFASAL